MSITARTPTVPFEVDYRKARPGELQLPALWAVPFDTEFRALELPNAPEDAHPAYASVGWHVCRNALRYCPAYHVMGTLNLRREGLDKKVLEEWQEKTKGHLVILNRRTGVSYWLAPSVSIMEAAISWFVRELGHDGLVLCHDKAEDVWYAEKLQPELMVTLDADGREVAQSDVTPGMKKQYLIEKHSNAIIISGQD